MFLFDILTKLDDDAMDEQQAARALATHINPLLIATALIEIRKQRNNWRERYIAQKETP